MAGLIQYPRVHTERRMFLNTNMSWIDIISRFISTLAFVSQPLLYNLMRQDLPKQPVILIDPISLPLPLFLPPSVIASHGTRAQDDPLAIGKSSVLPNPDASSSPDSTRLHR